jgi:hypothetical protein
MTPSFILGLFSETLERISKKASSQKEVKDVFFRKYNFLTKGRNADEIREQVEESIDDFFASKSALQDLIGGFGQKKD